MANKFIGRQQEVGIAREATRGVAVVPTFWVPKTSFTLEDKTAKARTMGSFGRIEGGDDALPTQQWAEGDMDMEITDKNIALLLYALFGTLTTGSYNSVYKHTLTVQQSVQPTSLTLMMNDPIGGGTNPTATLAYALATINSMELSMKMGELAMTTFAFISKQHQDYTRQTSSYSPQNRFAHQHLRLKLASSEAGLDAASKINVQEFKIKFERSVVRENALGTVQSVDIIARDFKVTGTIKLTYQDRAYRDYMLNGSKKSMRISLINGDVTIGTTNPQVQIDLASVDFFDWKPAQNLEDLATQEISFEALYDVTNGRLVGTNSFVVNSQASY